MQTSRMLLGWVICGLMLISGSVAMAQMPSADQLRKSQPNIVLVMTDDQGYGPIGALGHPWIQTPNLDKLHEQSVRLTRFLVSPTCAPTRSAMMTGRHPMRNGVTHTILERERMTLEATTLPQVLQDAGYATGIFGKWHLGDEDEYQPERRGFTETFIHGAGGIGQAYDCSCADAPNNKYFDPAIRHNGKFVKTEGYCTDLFFTAALGFIKQQQADKKPFFAYISTNAPHSPFIAPPANEKRFTDLGFTKNQAGFYGMIENIDENMGRLMEKLQQWNLAENTVLIFMSDNGMSGIPQTGFNQPMGRTPDGKAMLRYNAGMKGLKGSPDEGGVRVPFFVRWQSKLTPGRDVDRVAAHIDLFPTLAGLAGAEIPAEQVEGRDLLPLLVDAESAAWPDRMLVTHVCRWPTGANPDDHQWEKFALRTQQYRFVNNDSLFDMQADPGQENNIIEQHPQLVEQFRQQYNTWWQETKPLLVNEDAPMLPYRPFHVAYDNQLKSGGIPAWKPPVLEK